MNVMNVVRRLIVCGCLCSLLAPAAVAQKQPEKQGKRQDVPPPIEWERVKGEVAKVQENVAQENLNAIAEAASAWDQMNARTATPAQRKEAQGAWEQAVGKLASGLEFESRLEEFQRSLDAMEEHAQEVPPPEGEALGQLWKIVEDIKAWQKEKPELSADPRNPTPFERKWRDVMDDFHKWGAPLLPGQWPAASQREWGWRDFSESGRPILHCGRCGQWYHDEDLLRHVSLAHPDLYGGLSRQSSARQPSAFDISIDIPFDHSGGLSPSLGVENRPNGQTQVHRSVTVLDAILQRILQCPLCDQLYHDEELLRHVSVAHANILDEYRPSRHSSSVNRSPGRRSTSGGKVRGGSSRSGNSENWVRKQQREWTEETSRRARENTLRAGGLCPKCGRPLNSGHGFDGQNCTQSVTPPK